MKRFLSRNLLALVLCLSAGVALGRVNFARTFPEYLSHGHPAEPVTFVLDESTFLPGVIVRKYEDGTCQVYVFPSMDQGGVGWTEDYVPACDPDSPIRSCYFVP